MILKILSSSIVASILVLSAAGCQTGDEELSGLDSLEAGLSCDSVVFTAELPKGITYKPWTGMDFNAAKDRFYSGIPSNPSAIQNGSDFRISDESGNYKAEIIGRNGRVVSYFSTSDKNDPSATFEEKSSNGKVTSIQRKFNTSLLASSESHIPTVLECDGRSKSAHATITLVSGSLYRYQMSCANNEKIRVALGSPQCINKQAPTAQNTCDYSNADQHNGWGWDAVNGTSCPPEDSSVPPTHQADNCDYSDSGSNGGWGWDPVAQESCPPR